jgi:hypothetical protein
MSAALPANRAAAQYAMEQGRSLKDAQTVNVVLGPGLVDDADLYQRVTLELRKVGIAIAGEGYDVILNLSLEATPNTITQDVRFRMDVEQQVVVARTGEELQLVTWYYEHQQRINNASWNREAFTAIVEAGVDRFLSDYLTANGR